MCVFVYCDEFGLLKMSLCLDRIGYRLPQRVAPNCRFCAYPTTVLERKRGFPPANSSNDSPLIVRVFAASLVTKRKLLVHMTLRLVCCSSKTARHDAHQLPWALLGFTLKCAGTKFEPRIRPTDYRMQYLSY